MDIQDKYDAYSAAEMFCNPSEMESFSLVLMESWLAEKPALVNGRCAVTKDFVQRAGAGLYFDSYAEFEGTILYLTQHPETAAEMGRNGRQFVLENFRWDVIVKKYLELFERLGA